MSIKKFAVCLAVLGSLGVVSCAAPVTVAVAPATNVDGPISGPIIINSVVPVKDYEVVGIISVRSEVKVERVSQSRTVRTGSPVTFEMLMAEAQKLGADDIMNIRRDVYIQETHNNMGRVITTVYTHAATAIAIKYTDAMPFCDPRTVTHPRLTGQPQTGSPAATPARSGQRPTTPARTTPAQAAPAPQSQPQEDLSGGIEW